MAMNLDAYYRGLGADRLKTLGDELLALSREAGEAGADAAAWRLSSLSTQLHDLAAEVGQDG